MIFCFSMFSIVFYLGNKFATMYTLLYIYTILRQATWRYNFTVRLNSFAATCTVIVIQHGEGEKGNCYGILYTAVAR